MCIQNLHLKNKVKKNSVRIYRPYTCECNKVKVHTCTRKFDNSLLGYFSCQSTCSSCLEVPGSESCPGNGIVNHG